MHWAITKLNKFVEKFVKCAQGQSSMLTLPLYLWTRMKEREEGYRYEAAKSIVSPKYILFIFSNIIIYLLCYCKITVILCIYCHCKI